MRYSGERKAQSRERILRSAVKLFSHQGYEKTSIDEVMADAELTRGAFYAHFESKQQLYAEAITESKTFSVFTRPKPAEISDQDWVEQLISLYLNRRHITEVDLPCPLAFLATDVAVREPEIRRAYTDVYAGMNKRMHAYVSRYADCDEETVPAITAMMIGGVAVARALDNGVQRNRLLKSVRQTVSAMLQAKKKGSAEPLSEA
ncbi:MAG: TetR/AcrR family transcriptional regulator [Gammaproteobacteria bacterium]|nr:TetR/AcrR family transcriptional regulator [Gammaproteobacteria bacterium]MDH5650767.1 TetR/AcrR family transcriptional regulator [Gammaproteobacteria bacterium]